MISPETWVQFKDWARVVNLKRIFIYLFIYLFIYYSFSNSIKIIKYTEKISVGGEEASKSPLDPIWGMLPKKLQYNVEMYIIQIMSKSKIKIIF